MSAVYALPESATLNPNLLTGVLDPTSSLGAEIFWSCGQSPPLENAGFLRRNATLAIVLITNEDDCSAPPDSALFDSSSQLVSGFAVCAGGAERA